LILSSPWASKLARQESDIEGGLQHEQQLGNRFNNSDSDVTEWIGTGKLASSQGIPEGTCFQKTGAETISKEPSIVLQRKGAKQRVRW
jgi:hypothetical protein